MTTKQRHKSNGGFTLVELMVVISIIAVLASIVGIRVVRYLDESNVVAARAQIEKFNTALVAYRIKHKRFPDTLDGLVNPPSGEAILEAKSIPLDPWDQPYQYQLESARNYVIISLGADGVPGGSDVDADIRSDEQPAD